MVIPSLKQAYFSGLLSIYLPCNFLPASSVIMLVVLRLCHSKVLLYSLAIYIGGWLKSAHLKKRISNESMHQLKLFRIKGRTLSSVWLDIGEYSRTWFEQKMCSFMLFIGVSGKETDTFSFISH